MSKVLLKKSRRGLPEAHDNAISDFFGRTTSGLCVLPCNAANADDRETRAPDDNEGERQDETNFIRDIFLQRG